MVSRGRRVRWCVFWWVRLVVVLECGGRWWVSCCYDEVLVAVQWCCCGEGRVWGVYAWLVA